MSPRKIIIDTDPGVDDVLAILLALSSPEVTVSLISIVFGNTHAPTAHSNLLKIYHQLGAELDASSDAVKRYNLFAGQERTKTILALGEDQPIDGEKATAAYFHGMDGLSNISELHPHFNPPKRDETELHKYLDISSKPAWECILDQLRDEPEDTVDIVAVGPLTNLAHAFKNDPATFKGVHSVIWMGGAMDVPGNTSPSAEFNCFADPYAADQILAACKQGAFKLIMAPLDITSPHTVPFDDLIVTKPEDDVAKQDKNGVPGPLRVFISSFLHRVRGLQASFGAPDAMEMHDPLAIWYAIDNADLPTGSNGWETEQRDFKIERNGEITRGMCVIDRRGSKDGSGELRTKDESLQGNKVPGQKDQSEEEGQKPLPYIITKTPGKENLRKLLLARVFGEEV